MENNENKALGGKWGRSKEEKKKTFCFKAIFSNKILWLQFLSKFATKKKSLFQAFHIVITFIFLSYHHYDLRQ